MKKDQTPEYMKQLSGKILEINYKIQSLKMSFQATEDICHSNGTIIQGGFTTVMMDSWMAFLVMELTEFQKTPMSIDINVNFLSAGSPGLVIAKSKIIKLGKSIGFISAELFQNEKKIATASSSIKLASFPGINFLKDNVGKNAKIVS